MSVKSYDLMVATKLVPFCAIKAHMATKWTSIMWCDEYAWHFVSDIWTGNTALHSSKSTNDETVLQEQQPNRTQDENQYEQWWGSSSFLNKYYSYTSVKLQSSFAPTFCSIPTSWKMKRWECNNGFDCFLLPSPLISQHLRAHRNLMMGQKHNK